MTERQIEFLLNECKCTLSNVTNKSRKANIVEARQIIAYIMRRNGAKYHEICRTIGRSHQTCIYAVDRIYTLLSVGDKRTKYLIERLKGLEK